MDLFTVPLAVGRVNFQFKGCWVVLFNFIHSVANSKDSDHTPPNTASDLGLHYLSLSHEKDDSLISVNLVYAGNI